MIETEQTDSGSSGDISSHSLERSRDTGTYNSTSACLPDGSSDPCTGLTPPMSSASPSTHTTSIGTQPHTTTSASPDGGTSAPELESSPSHGKFLCPGEFLGMAWHGAGKLFDAAIEPLSLVPILLNISRVQRLWLNQNKPVSARIWTAGDRTSRTLGLRMTTVISHAVNALVNYSAGFRLIMLTAKLILAQQDQRKPSLKSITTTPSENLTRV